MSCAGGCCCLPLGERCFHWVGCAEERTFILYGVVVELFGTPLPVFVLFGLGRTNLRRECCFVLCLCARALAGWSEMVLCLGSLCCVFYLVHVEPRALVPPLGCCWKPRNSKESNICVDICCIKKVFLVFWLQSLWAYVLTYVCGKKMGVVRVPA